MPTKGKSSHKAKRTTRHPRESQTAASDAAKHSTAQTAAQTPMTDNEKRRAKNEYVKAWRAAHKDQYAAYMKEWREKKGKAPSKASPKKTASKKEKKSLSPDTAEPVAAAAAGESAA